MRLRSYVSGSDVRPLLMMAAMFLVPAALYAQSGCGDSPENPTAILLLVGAAGYSWPLLWARWKKH